MASSTSDETPHDGNRDDGGAGDSDPWQHCERQLLALAQALPIGVVVLGDGAISSVNAVAARQLQIDPANASVRAPMQLFADPDIGAAALSGALAVPGSLQLLRGNGESFHAELSVHWLNLGLRQCRVLLFDDRSERDWLDTRLQQQHEQLQAVTGRLLTAQEDERRTLSRELHDDIGQSITAIKLGAAALADGDPARQEVVDEIVAIADQTVAKLRDLAMLLRPPQLDALGLEAAVRWQAQTMFRGAQPSLELALSPLPVRPPVAVELACFRIVQEALTNVLRHADATRVRVVLAPDAGMLALHVSDDGNGFDAGQASGLGVVIMRERAQLAGGSFDLDTAPGAGTRIDVRLPLAPALP